ncbi:succinate-semialdehyde dehydrogenase [Schizosaccharomyces cryophilus OY26]|uniref:Succinate-semialdehyde dehydrogenase n=1 Tax=Schizosaccharomyces cryophilus (strain OY26 / ATCC MYA-4695 / CBS 11777 / NBRC 106824 / NRRL Y48691) TaxID=653667 RepID=S9W4G8_SCHCR|nr:succinate-semialdehyde dehydrogenase [Schizosaccharomyces cryophilus OY26]EPY53414.1 succinate-semialdehyde dehydrogenase [Schizosaccharomyces cryophilus OY26]
MRTKDLTKSIQVGRVFINSTRWPVQVKERTFTTGKTEPTCGIHQLSFFKRDYCSVEGNHIIRNYNKITNKQDWKNKFGKYGGRREMSKMANQEWMSKIQDTELFDLKEQPARSFIGGKWVAASSGKVFDVEDPGHNRVIASVTDLAVEETREAIEIAHRAFQSYRHSSVRERAALLRRWYDLMLENADDLATMMTLENGKSLSDSKGEVIYAANFLDWFAGEALRINGDSHMASAPNNRILTVKQPVGVVGIITPWNFPAAMITRKVGAALAAGCTMVIRPAAETPFSAIALAKLAERAGVPAGVLNMITSDSAAEHGLELTTNPLVRKVSFTGSTNVGKLLANQSSSTLKKLSLELGGNAPFIVFEDADLQKAADALIACKFRGSGQTCVCANRIFVHSNVYTPFVQLVYDRVSQFRLGYGLDEGITHGPLVSRKAVHKVQEHVNDALNKGATALTGGSVASELGPCYFHPTVLVGAKQNMLIAQEETFGPVCALFEFSTEEEVLKLANSTPVGLAGYLFSKDISRIFRVAEALEVGMVGCNTGVVSDVLSPFGGVKESGYGREGSHHGISEYLDIKSLTISID